MGEWTWVERGREMEGEGERGGAWEECWKTEAVVLVGDHCCLTHSRHRARCQSSGRHLAMLISNKHLVHSAAVSPWMAWIG